MPVTCLATAAIHDPASSACRLFETHCGDVSVYTDGTLVQLYFSHPNGRAGTKRLSQRESAAFLRTAAPWVADYGNHGCDLRDLVREFGARAA